MNRGDRPLRAGEVNLGYTIAGSSSSPNTGARPSAQAVLLSRTTRVEIQTREAHIAEAASESGGALPTKELAQCH